MALFIYFSALSRCRIAMERTDDVGVFSSLGLGNVGDQERRIHLAKTGKFHRGV